MATRRHALLIRPVAKIPQCSSLMSHNAPFCNIFVTKWCIVGYLPGASWDLWDGSITEYQVEILIKQNCRFFQVLIKEIRHCRKLSLNLHQCIWQGIRSFISSDRVCHFLITCYNAIPQTVNGTFFYSLKSRAIKNTWNYDGHCVPPMKH